MSAGAIEQAHLRFALSIHGAVAGHGGDSCYSPYSVASALGLVVHAARGAAADEVAALLAGPDRDVADQADLLRKAAELTARGEQDEPVLAVSNTLWAWDELPIESGYVEELRRWPSGSVASAPFVTDPEGARAAINADVAATTHDLIPELLQPGQVADDTVAGIVNALYLRVAWLHAFRTADTEAADFHAPSGARQVPTMRQSEQLPYAAQDGWQAVTLPAVGGVEAVVLLPDGDLTEPESTLDAGRLGELLSARQVRQVNLSLPKLSLDVHCELKEALRGLGVRTVFTRGADLSGLTPDPRAEVSDVAHQAVLRLDESGLEGAAATAAMMRLVSMPAGEPVTVRADRPFLLLVRHSGTGAVYFLARVVEP